MILNSKIVGTFLFSQIENPGVDKPCGTCCCNIPPVFGSLLTPKTSRTVTLNFAMWQALALIAKS